MRSKPWPHQLPPLPGSRLYNPKAGETHDLPDPREAGRLTALTLAVEYLRSNSSNPQAVIATAEVFRGYLEGASDNG